MNFDNRKNGTVILLGAGPGDPGLLTVKGNEALSKADCIIYDRLASPELLLAAKEGCELIYVGKADHHHVLPQDEINALLVKKAKEHALVVRLKGGDPYVFGRGGEEGMYLLANGIDFSVIPGVTSAVAALSAAGIPITHRGIATAFRVMTAHGKEDRLTDIDFSKLTDEKETLVFLMGLSHVKTIADRLIAAGRDADTPAAVISCATTKEQRTVIGTLFDIAECVKKEALTSPAIIAVGNVVSLAEKLKGRLCTGVMPQTGGDAANNIGAQAQIVRDKEERKTYIVPYIKSIDTSRTSLAALLKRAGAGVIEIPVGEICICPVDFSDRGEEDALSQNAFHNGSLLRETMPDRLIFTSRNAVDGFFRQLLEKEIDVRTLSDTKIAAVGEHTACQLKKYGLFADLIPTVSTGEALGEELARLSEQNDRVWYVRGKDGGDAITKAFAGYPNYREIMVYENQTIAYDDEKKRELCETIRGADGIFFTSASCVRRICAITEELPREIYSIGPSCTKQLKELGFSKVSEAKTPSYESLTESYIRSCLVLRSL